MRIAICDNDPHTVERLNSILVSTSREHRGIDVYTYFSGEELVGAFEKKGMRFDMVFLDIKMSRLDGISVAKVITGLQSSCLIFLVTAYMDYVLKGYEVRAFRYIMKPFKDEEIKKHFLYAVRELLDEGKRYSVHTKSTILTYNPDDIVFLESTQRQVILNTLTARTSFYSKLGNEEEKLKGFGFVRVHQGFLVNMAYIKTIIENNIILTNGAAIPMSKSKKKEALNCYTKYLTEFDGI